MEALRRQVVSSAFVLGEPRANHHPTVKPLDLMKYLCKITATPTGGLVLDPFTGSGTTLVAAELMGRKYIGIEISKEYCEIARKRVQEAKDSLGLFNNQP